MTHGWNPGNFYLENKNDVDAGLISAANCFQSVTCGTHSAVLKAAQGPLKAEGVSIAYS
jgi:hypothetical protein